MVMILLQLSPAREILTSRGHLANLAPSGKLTCPSDPRRTSMGRFQEHRFLIGSAPLSPARERKTVQ
jgi:hypothetical protein